MNADICWLDDPKVFRVNQLPAHSDHKFYRSEEEYKKEKSGWKKSLNGVWKFQYSENAVSRPIDFYKEDFDASGFDEITVPGHIEMAGYDRLHYINIMYPWEGHEYRRPAYTEAAKGQRENLFSGAEYNPVGSYLLKFDLPKEMKGKRISICFEGVEQAMYLWLNETFIGYAEDSFTLSEFDLTDVIRDKDNVLAVEVHKRSTAAFLEDQDFFRFFGIFRDVTLQAKPDIHMEDLWIRPDYEAETKKGMLRLQMKIDSLQQGGSVEIAVKDGETVVLSDKQTLTDELQVEYEMPESVTPWDNHNPYLYTLEIRLYDAKGNLVEIVPYEFGFRCIEIVDKVIRLNGERLIICGVNRHEWSAETGRCIGEKERQWDMACFKRNNINAVRTCHYPDQIPWYYLCDKEGVYMMAEVNLETHGSWGKLDCIDEAWNMPGSFPEWEAVVLDRAKTNFEMFKNHTSVLFWSLGNESYAGDNLLKMHEYYKATDPDRIVHYEGVFFGAAYRNRISDVESRMYAYPAEIRKYLEEKADKPFLLCEYMHDMGNSMGGMKSYMDLIDDYEMYQGGFIWDFIDQALFAKDEVTGRETLRYGGDFDDRPADNEFSGNGIVFANRQEKPAMQEVRYYYGLYK